MGYVEDLKDSKHGQGRNRWRGRWRDPAGRHTCASLLIREGASIKAVQHHLGHKSASIILDRYGHLFRRSWTTRPTASTGCMRRLACTQRVPTPRWPPLDNAKRQV